MSRGNKNTKKARENSASPKVATNARTPEQAVQSSTSTIEASSSAKAPEQVATVPTVSVETELETKTAELRSTAKEPSGQAKEASQASTAANRADSAASLPQPVPEVAALFPTAVLNRATELKRLYETWSTELAGLSSRSSGTPFESVVTRVLSDISANVGKDPAALAGKGVETLENEHDRLKIQIQTIRENLEEWLKSTRVEKKSSSTAA